MRHPPTCSGTFANELNVVEDAARRQLTFSLVQSAFMKDFLGSWDVRPLPDGGAEVRRCRGAAEWGASGGVPHGSGPRWAAAVDTRCRLVVAAPRHTPAC